MYLGKIWFNLLGHLNPEPVIYRLSQLGILTQCNVENILANPTRHAKSSALLHLVPSKGPAAFQNFCRALSCTGQQRLRTLINPDGNKWSVSDRLLIEYEGGQSLFMKKGERMLAISCEGWTRLMKHIPEIQIHLDKESEVKLLLDHDQYVVVCKFQDQMYVGFHFYAGHSIVRGSGFNISMTEWTSFLQLMDTINQEVDLSQSVSYPVNSYELIKHCYHYLLERQIVHLRDGNCFGCQNDCPGQKNHMEGGCLSEWNESVNKYFAEAVIKFDRGVFLQVTR